MKINLKECFETAEALYYQIIDSKHLTDEIRIIIGMEPIEKYESDVESDADVEYERNSISLPKSTLDEDDICDIAMQFSYN